jgi:tetratricopeptide (TPR) repeat protein
MPEPSLEAHMRRAVFFYERRRYDDALTACLDALTAAPQASQPLVLAAWCSVSRKDFDAARNFARQTLGQAPDEDQAHAVLAVVADHERRFESAGAHMERAIAIAPDNSLHRVTHAYILARWGRIEEAITAARQGLKLDPESGAAALALASFYRLNEEPELAERYANLALSVEPSAAAHHLEEGLRLLGHGNAREARGRFLESLRLDPADGESFEAIAHEKVRNHPFFRRALFPPRRADLAIAALMTPVVWYLLSLLFSPFAWLAVASAVLLAAGYLHLAAFLLCRRVALRRLRDGRL